jgi:hypothetical protein
LILDRLPFLLVLAVVVSGSMAATAGAAAPGHGRAWELVTPSDPVAAIVLDPLKLSPDGTRLAYASIGPMPGADAGDVLAANRATRGPAGWISEPLGPPYSFDGEVSVLASFSVAFDQDLSTAIWAALVPLTGDAPPQGRYALYRRDESGNLTLLVALGEAEPQFVRASDDARHVVFTSAEHLVPADAGRIGGESLYEVSGTELRMVDVDDAGNALSPCGAGVGQVGAVSGSGERIFFTSSGTDCAGPSRVYMREGGTRTVEVGESQCTRPDCNGASDVAFAGATPSGSKVFLTTVQQLTDADVDEASDLYAYDVETGELGLLSGTEGASGQVPGQMVVASSTGDRVYFFADGQLIAGQGTDGGSNLYLAGPSGLRFVASLPQTPLGVSAGGAKALLATSVALEAADTDDRVDVYRYDAGAGSLTRLSTGPSGGNGPLDALMEVSASPLVPAGGQLALHPLSDDGGHAFFTTAERLVAEDEDDAIDLYEWSGGAVALLSSGTAGDKVEFAGASRDGGTAMFRTSASLLATDRDGGDHDIYAARLGGGFPELPPVLTCEGADCRTEGRGPAGVTLPALASSKPPPKARRRLRLGRIPPETGRRIARTGTAKLVVVAPAAGLVRARAWVRSGDGERSVGSGRVGAVRPGKVTLALSFAASVRKRLRRGAVAPIKLVLRQGRARAVVHLRLTSGVRR